MIRINKQLIGFIKALENKGVINFNVNQFTHRFKLQKYVYLARGYKLNLDYTYNLYIHGPYSPDLATAYYSLGKQSEEYSNIALNDDFVNLIKGKSERWLELAATIVMVKERYGNIGDKTIIKLVKNSKPSASEEELKKIISELKLRKAI